MDSTLRTTITWMLRAVKVGTGAAAVVLSGGAGGDTAVDVISVTITSSQLATELVKPGNAELISLLGLDFKDGPEGIEKRVNQIYTKLTPDLLGQLDDIFALVNKAFSDWISAFIPDDGGITGIFLEEVLSAATHRTYDVLVGIFMMLPVAMRDLFVNPGKMESFLRDLLKILKDTAMPKPTFGGFGMVPLPIPALLLPNPSSFVMDKVIELLEKKLDPAIPKATEVFSKIIPIVFGILYIKKLRGNGVSTQTDKGKKQRRNGFYLPDTTVIIRH